MNQIIIFIAEYLLFIMLLLAGIWWLWRCKEKRQVVLTMLFSGLIALVLAKVGSHFIADPRPFTQGLVPLFGHSADNGFPSDHTLLAATVAFVVMAFDRYWGTGLLIGGLLIGVARVMANVHHMLDIVGSIVIAAVAVSLVCGIMYIWRARHGLVSTNNITRQDI